MYKSHHVSAIVTCAGRGVRFGSNKLLIKMNGVTILENGA
jgi:CTP:molybdopterin cytidylyltransferase MocA